MCDVHIYTKKFPVPLIEFKFIQIEFNSNKNFIGAFGCIIIAKSTTKIPEKVVKLYKISW